MHLFDDILDACEEQKLTMTPHYCAIYSPDLENVFVCFKEKLAKKDSIDGLPNEHDQQPAMVKNSTVDP